MSRYLIIDGKRYAWRDILQKRREQLQQSRQPQPTLFELKEDAPTAIGAYRCREVSGTDAL